ncbi:hypothetical protein R3I93_008711 [Phoxinus phoxinus]|uniref:Ferric-chelate reductase 1 n=1 Tax=Phoxinus phoxinus TaxID=58324 RepID=A0AAN9H6X4_9TELE
MNSAHFPRLKINISTGKDTSRDMESKLMFLVVCVIGCAVSCIKADDNLPTTSLTSNITRNECGKTKLCLDTPKGCDPSGSSQCFFTSVVFTNTSVTVELSGNSTGYIALAAGLTSNISQDGNIIFVCVNNNSRLFFQTKTLYNNTLEITNIPNVTNIQGLIQSSLIQCVFTIHIDETVTFFLSSGNGTHFNTSDIANSQILMFLDIWKGSTNGTVLGAPTSELGSSVLVNLANVNSTNVVSTPAGTTAGTTANTTAGTTANTTAGTTANTTAGTTASTTANTTAGTTAGTTANTTAGTTANTTAGTPAGTTTNTTAGTTAGTTANTTAGTTAGTTANTTAGTTANTTAGTTADTTAKSNASISLSFLSRAAICLLSIFLRLI